MKVRILSVIFALLFFGLIARLFYWQVIKGAELSIDGQNQYSSSKVTQAPRGSILASDGSFWALRSDAWLIYANTNEMSEPPKKVAEKLATFFVDDPDDMPMLLNETLRIEGILGKKAAWLPIKQKVTSEVKKNIEALRIKGIGFESQEARYYPEGSSAAQILGFVGKDENGGDIGYFGLEGYYNLPLSGKSGFLGREKDARGAPILVNGVNQVSAVSGVNLKTNVDKRAQLLVEEKLKEGIDKYGASGGHVTIMDPTSGRVMAMAGYPSFDPQEYVKYGDSLFKNPVISDTFEPGSIFKVLVMAAGLDAGVIEPDTKCDICAGPLKIDKYFIKTWNDEYHPDISMTDVIVHSDNVGMTFIGRKLGAEAMFDYLDKFGIGKTSGIDLQGESAVALRKKGTWNDVDLATASFGQGVAVNGIQMVRAVAAVANGGYLVTPRVVNSVQGDAWEEEIKSDPPKRIISRQAAEETAQMMVQASDKGEAKWANVSGFSIAGKTGTAQIPVSGHYDSTNTNVSFIGFAPAVNPKFVMLVTLKSPQSSPWAAETAAPLWYSIAKELFPYLGVSPSQ